MSRQSRATEPIGQTPFRLYICLFPVSLVMVVHAVRYGSASKVQVRSAIAKRNIHLIACCCAPRGVQITLQSTNAYNTHTHTAKPLLKPKRPDSIACALHNYGRQSHLLKFARAHTKRETNARTVRLENLSVVFLTMRRRGVLHQRRRPRRRLLRTKCVSCACVRSRSVGRALARTHVIIKRTRGGERGWRTGRTHSHVGHLWSPLLRLI